MNSLIWIFGAVALLALAVFIFELNYPRMRKVRPYVYGVPHEDRHYGRSRHQVQYMLVTHHSGIFTKRRHGNLYDTEDRAEKARMEMIERELQLGRVADELRDKITSARGQK